MHACVCRLLFSQPPGSAEAGVECAAHMCLQPACCMPCSSCYLYSCCQWLVLCPSTTRACSSFSGSDSCCGRAVVQRRSSRLLSGVYPVWFIPRQCWQRLCAARCMMLVCACILTVFCWMAEGRALQDASCLCVLCAVLGVCCACMCCVATVP